TAGERRRRGGAARRRDHRPAHRPRGHRGPHPGGPGGRLTPHPCGRPARATDPAHAGRPARGERAFFLTGVLLTGDPSHRGSDGDLVPGAPLGDGVAVVADLADADADLVHVVLPEREVPDVAGVAQLVGARVVPLPVRLVEVVDPDLHERALAALLQGTEVQVVQLALDADLVLGVGRVPVGLDRAPGLGLEVAGVV